MGGGGSETNSDFSKDDIQAGIAGYQVQGMMMNRNLREGNALPETQQKIDDIMQTAMEPQKEKETVWRGAGEDSDLDDAAVGDIIVDHGYLSTSTSQDIIRPPDQRKEEMMPFDWSHGWTGTITLNPGTQTVHVNQQAGKYAFKNLKEVVLDKEGQYRVDKIDHDKQTFKLTKIN